MFPNPFRHLTCKVIFNHWIYFFPTPSTILHLSKCFEVRAKSKLIPGVQGNPERLFRSRIGARKQNCPLGPAAKFSCSLLKSSSTLLPYTLGTWPERGNTWMSAPRWNESSILHFFLAALAREGARGQVSKSNETEHSSVIRDSLPTWPGHFFPFPPSFSLLGGGSVRNQWLGQN